MRRSTSIDAGERKRVEQHMKSRSVLVFLLRDVHDSLSKINSCIYMIKDYIHANVHRYFRYKNLVRG